MYRAHVTVRPYTTVQGSQSKVVPVPVTLLLRPLHTLGKAIPIPFSQLPPRLSSPLGIPSIPPGPTSTIFSYGYHGQSCSNSCIPAFDPCIPTNGRNHLEFPGVGSTGSVYLASPAAQQQNDWLSEPLLGLTLV